MQPSLLLAQDQHAALQYHCILILLLSWHVIEVCLSAYCAFLLLLYRYEELQRQLAAAQAAAEVEEEEAELARAAAAVARLTAPDFEGCGVPSSSGSSNNSNDNGSAADGSVGVSEESEGGPAAAKVRMLQEQVKGAREEVHSAPEEETPPGSVMPARH